MAGIIIAIDGVSGCGKSTTAKAVAKELSYVYIDTGAMYRSVALYFLDYNVDIENDASIAQALENISIDFIYVDGHMRTRLNGVDVEDEIRTLRVSNFVSPVAAIKAVRDKLVSLQREMGEKGGVVMDGRDIGTNVFPHAELKVFMSASAEVRAQRRVDELEAKGEAVNYDEVYTNLVERDRIDSGRKESPLLQAEDAHVIDTSGLEIHEQVEQVLALHNTLV